MTATAELATTRHPGYRHEAFLYRGDAEFVSGCLPFLRAGLDAGEPVMVAVVPSRIALLRDALGAAAAGIRFVDMAELGRNPARILPAWVAFVDEYGVGKQPVRGIGEPVWAGRRDAEVLECQLHEALLNVAIDPDTSFWLRCPYDVAALPQATIDAVSLSHPVLVGPDEFRGSTGYGGLHLVESLFHGELAESPSESTEAVSEFRFGADDLTSLRRLVGRAADDVGLSGDRVADLELAVHEIAANSIRHGGGQGRVRAWTGDGALHYEVLDAGSIADPLVGRVAPALDAESGRGVWIANQVSDLVQIRSSERGTTVRVLAWL
jgi:anti-sigma regulatory factor (Ser/Thr protein kinase)